MKKGRFLWSAHRITERQKAGKARSIKGKQLKNSRSTVSRQLVAHLSSARDNRQPKSIEKFGKLRFFELFWCIRQHTLLMDKDFRRHSRQCVTGDKTAVFYHNKKEDFRLTNVN